MNQDLRNHVTSVAFHLSLSQGQVAVLVWLNEAIERDWVIRSHRPLAERGRGPQSIPMALDQFVMPVKALERKGLVEHCYYEGDAPERHKRGERIATPDVYRITAAGELVVGLLREAGLYTDVLRQIPLLEVRSA